MSHLITVVGASGKVGGGVASALLDGGHRVRAFGRHADALAPLAARGAELHLGDLNDLRALAEALRGVDAAFLMIPPNYQAPDGGAFIRGTAGVIAQAAKIARLPQAVIMSSIGANEPQGLGQVSALHDWELLMRDVGIPLAILRPAYFMENWFSAIGLIRGMGIIGSAEVPDRKSPRIATRDISVVAARLLDAGAIVGQEIVELHGERDLSQQEATSVLGAAIDKPDLAYVQFPPDQAVHGMVGAGLSQSSAEMLVEMALGFSRGLGRPLVPRSPATTTPTSIEWFAEHVFAPAFAAGGGGH